VNAAVKVRLVCFDLDGTLVDSVEDIRDGLRAALAAVPPAGQRDDEALALAGFGLPLEEFFALARAPGHPHHGPTGEARFVDAYKAHYAEHLLDRTRPFEGVVAMLQALRARTDLRVAIATTKRSETARRIVEGLGLHPYFHHVRGSEGLRPKPAPDVLMAIAEELAIDPPGRADGVMVGDTIRDVAAAHAAGMRSCAVAWGETGAERLRAAGAHAIAFHPRDVLDFLG
jgi:phosphoglycolate phosphatase